jgi:hypothetical protein
MRKIIYFGDIVIKVVLGFVRMFLLEFVLTKLGKYSHLAWGGFCKKTKTDRKKPSEPGFLKHTFESRNYTVKKDTTRYPVLTQDIKRKVFWRRYQISNKLSSVVCKCQNVWFNCIKLV